MYYNLISRRDFGPFGRVFPFFVRTHVMNIEKTVNNLTRNGFKAFFVEDEKEAVQKILSLIPVSESAGFGGSATLTALNVAELLQARGNRIFHRSLTKGLSQEEIVRNAAFADWFLMSSNAVTEEGELVNTDGNGNRVSASIYGGKNTLVVAGVNKIVPDLASAFERIRTVAAPLNARRFNRPTPCTSGGSCKDCPAELTLCKSTVIQHRPSTSKNHYVILINKNLGF